MGTTKFTTSSVGQTAEDAFFNAIKQAKHYYGHSGYTGSIAEKHSFIMMSEETLSADKAIEFAQEAFENGNSKIHNKWGPAGCVKYKITGDDGTETIRYLFFGWASC